MRAIQSLFPLIFLVCSHCGQIGEFKDNGNKDKGFDNGLTEPQLNKTATVFGSLGDLQFVIHEIGNFNVDATSSLAVDRSKQRLHLRRSMPTNQCVVSDKGSLEFGEFNFQVAGDFCGSSLSYSQTRQVLSDSVTEKVEVLELSGRYSRRSLNVATDIRELALKGRFQKTFKKEAEVSEWNQELKFQMRGTSRVAGLFAYEMEESWMEKRDAQEERVGLLRRADHLTVGQSYKATLTRTERYLNGRLQGVLYRLNADSITQSDYRDLMQDLHNQWGVEPVEVR